MKKTQLISLAIVACLLGPTSCNEAEFTHPEPTVQKQKAVTTNDGYNVTAIMLDNYLKLVHIDKDVKNIKSIKDGEQTLAYLVNLKDGWKLISADTRKTPVQAFAKSGTLNLTEESNPAVQLVFGIAAEIRNFKANDKTVEKNGIWKAIEGQIASKAITDKSNKAIARGIGMGMWIAQGDPEYTSETEETPHIITTKWGGGAPYNQFMPYSNTALTQNYNISCVAVASGQIVYHFRKDNNRGITVPVEAYLPNEPNKEMVVTRSSVDGWQLIGKYHNHASMFLAQIAKEVHENYTDTSAYANEAKNVFDKYLLAYSSLDGYDYHNVLYSLQNSYPVFVSGGVKGSYTGHSFIIDSYRSDIENMVINYVWDPEHRITEEEKERYPAEMFKLGADGSETKQEIVSNDENTYFAMNWGEYGGENAIYYLAREYSAPISGSDFAGDYYKPGKDVIYPPSWANKYYNITNVKLMIYNIREK